MWKNSVSRNKVSNHAKTNTFQTDQAWECIKCDTEWPTYMLCKQISCDHQLYLLDTWEVLSGIMKSWLCDQSVCPKMKMANITEIYFVSSINKI